MKKLDLTIFEKDEARKDEGYIEIAAEQGQLQLPVYLIQNGNGPRITIVGAQHSCEYCGTDALVQLIQDFREMKPTDINGSVVLIPVANLPGYPVRALNVSQFDGSNLNRSYPGKPDGTTSERIAHTIWRIAKTGNYVLDLHGGDMTEDIIQYAEMHVSPQEEINRQSLKLAACFDLNTVLFSVSGTDYGYPDFRSLYGLAQENGIPAAIVEAGGSGISDEGSVEYFYEGIKNVLNQLGMAHMSVKDGYDQIKDRLWVTRSVTCMERPGCGIFRSHVKAGDHVTEGQVIGQVSDYFGDIIDTITSPRTGIISLVHSPRGKNDDDMIYMILEGEKGCHVEIK